MKKYIASIMLVVLVVCSTAQAVEPRAITGHPGLTINGTTAICEAVCTSDVSTDRLKVELTLYCGDEVIDSWSKTAYGRVIMSETCTVERNKRYDLQMVTYRNSVQISDVTVYNYS